MKLPNHERAIIPRRKITEYLLSPTHRDGKSKATFFTQFGFSIDKWEDLEGALRRQTAETEVSVAEQSPFGTRYVIDGIIYAPDGRTPRVRSVWFVGDGEEIPRFATAYPLKSR